MKIIFSKSGSDGNCTVIRSSDGKLLTIDAGIKWDIVNRRVDYSLHLCKSVLLTHHHKDHCSEAKAFKERGAEVYATEDTIVNSGIENMMFKIINGNDMFKTDGFKIMSFPLAHTNSDGTDCKCIGFLILDVSSGEKLLHCTDTAYIPYRFPPLDFINIEANYVEQNDYSEDLEAIERVVEKRRFMSHMSLQSAAEFLAKQDLSKCKEIRLIHLSHSLTQAERDSIVPFIQSKIGRSDIPIVF